MLLRLYEEGIVFSITKLEFNFNIYFVEREPKIILI
jgi:hypothetical protein